MSRVLYQGVGPHYQRGVQSRWCVPTPETHPLINARGGGVAKFVPSRTREGGRPGGQQLLPIMAGSARPEKAAPLDEGERPRVGGREGGRHPGRGHRYTPAKPSPITHERQPAQLRPVRSPRHRPPAEHRRSPRHRHGHAQPGQTGARPAGEHAPRSHQEPRKASPRYIDTPPRNTGAQRPNTITGKDGDRRRHIPP